MIESGSSKSHPFFVLFERVSPEKEGHYSRRYSVIIPKKLIRSAVKRNRKRRQIYEIIRLLEKEKLVRRPPHSDIVLLARKPVPLSSFADLEKVLKDLLTS